LTNKFYLIHTI